MMSEWERERMSLWSICCGNIVTNIPLFFQRMSCQKEKINGGDGGGWYTGLHNVSWLASSQQLSSSGCTTRQSSTSTAGLRASEPPSASVFVHFIPTWTGELLHGGRGSSEETSGDWKQVFSHFSTAIDTCYHGAYVVSTCIMKHSSALPVQTVTCRIGFRSVKYSAGIFHHVLWTPVSSHIQRATLLANLEIFQHNDSALVVTNVCLMGSDCYQYVKVQQDPDGGQRSAWTAPVTILLCHTQVSIHAHGNKNTQTGAGSSRTVVHLRSCK